MPAPLDKRLLQRATATRFFLVAVALTGIANAALVIVQAYLIAHAVAGIFYHHSFSFPGPFDSFGSYIVGLAVVFALRGAMSWLNSLMAYRASASVKSQLRTDVLAATLANPTSTRSSSSSLITLVTSGLDALDGYFEKYLPQLVMAAFIPILVVAVVAAQDWESALIIIVTIPLIPIFMILIGLMTRDAVDRRYALMNRLANHFADLISGLPTLQVFGRARAQLKGLGRTEDEFRSVTLKTLRIAFLSGGVLELLATLSVALVAVTIGFRVVNGGMDLTTSLFILIMAPEAYLPVRQVGVHFHDSANGIAASTAALAAIKRGESAIGGPTPAPNLADSPLVFESVSVRYSDASVDALHDLSFTLEPGSSLALTGRSGSGKSTALAVALGFLDPSSGTVRVGDVPLSEIDQRGWRDQIAYVAQNPGMIHGDIAANIAMGVPDATKEQLRDALDRAGGELLSLDRSVGDDGEGLSAGERRRVGLARALLRIERGPATLLVLDEPTAGLDQASEAVAVDAVRKAGASMIFVTHREAMLNLADTRINVEANQ